MGGKAATLQQLLLVLLRLLLLLVALLYSYSYSSLPTNEKVTIRDNFVDMPLRQDALEKSVNPIGHLEANRGGFLTQAGNGSQNVIFALLFVRNSP